MGHTIEKINKAGDVLWSYDSGEDISADSLRHRTIGSTENQGVPPFEASFGMPAPTLSGSATPCNQIKVPAMGASFALICDDALVPGGTRTGLAPPMAAEFAMGVPTPVVSPMRATFALKADRVTVGHVLHAVPMQASFALICDDALTPGGTRTGLAPAMAAEFSMVEPYSVYQYKVGVWGKWVLPAPPMGASFALTADGVSLISGAYACVLTGGPDGLPNVTIPISSFQSRIRSGNPSYLSVIVPNAPKWLPYIVARSNGEIVVYQGRDALARVNYEYISYNQGARNSSLQLTGYKTSTYSAPKTVVLRKVSVIALQQTGLKRITAAVDYNVRPGDTVTWPGGSMTAGMIALAVSTRQGTMTVTEAE